MNLGVEYLVRTGAIKNFLEVPCSLFVESHDGQTGKAIHLKEALGRPGLCFYRIWHLDRTDNYTLLPACDETHISIDDVFESDMVVLPGYAPLPYIEQPVKTAKNSYKSPMDDIEYNHFTSNYLRSPRHRQSRLCWLWRQFMKLHLRDEMYEDWDERDLWGKNLISEREMITIKYAYPRLWTQWASWQNELLIDGTVAAELVFAPAYAKKGSSSFSQVS